MTSSVKPVTECQQDAINGDSLSNTNINGRIDEKSSNLAQDSPNENHDANDNDSEPISTHQYATPKELSLLSTVFTIATFMIAIDGSILGRKSTTLKSLIAHISKLLRFRV